MANGYLTFISDQQFTLQIASDARYEGSLEISRNKTDWYEVIKGENYTTTSETSIHSLYLRGSNNTYIYRNGNSISIEGSNVKCEGNMETLLDYQTVLNGAHPSMTSPGFRYFFWLCEALTQAPELPATTLMDSCYDGMFSDCKNLTQAPELPATTLAPYCYRNMFTGCGKLTTPPSVLPALKLENSCYAQMFSESGLLTAPEILATSVASGCCSGMFLRCKSLTTPPSVLPAKTLAEKCYNDMFTSCNSLVTAPELPATTLAPYCYNRMFSYCDSLTTPPELPATVLAPHCYEEMFESCIGLTQAPELPATTLMDSCYEGMFRDCIGLVIPPELPAKTIPSKAYYMMFFSCKFLKLSKTQDEKHTVPYRIPTSGTGTLTGDKNGLYYMFYSVGSATINTTYYYDPTIYTYQLNVNGKPCNTINGKKIRYLIYNYDYYKINQE